jgi:hypothetical protein
MNLTLQLLNTLRTGDADLRLYAYELFKYPVPNVLISSDLITSKFGFKLFLSV